MQKLFGIIHFSAIVLSVKPSEIKKDVNYCELPCELTKKEHFICNLQHKCGKGPACVSFKGSEYTTELKEATLYWHNYYRNYVALGKENRGINRAQPKAANMRELVWDNELEYIAQCHANQCIFEHDQCRRSSATDIYRPPGQNLAAMADSSKNNEELIESMIKMWYDEVELVDPAILEKFPWGSSRIGHYTQMVWAETSRLGCGFVLRDMDGYQNYSLLACNYAIGGNLITGKVYQTGSPCSQCSGDSKCHPEFLGLCSTGPSNSSFPDISKYAPGGYNENDIIKYAPPKQSVAASVPELESAAKITSGVNVIHLLLFLLVVMAIL